MHIKAACLLFLAPVMASAAIPAQNAAPAQLFTLDASRTEVTAKVRFFGLASKTAHFPKSAGRIVLTSGQPQNIDLEVTLDARALKAGDETTRSRLVSARFFDVENHPLVRFRGDRMTQTGATTAQVQGMITARGVTRPAELDVTFARSPASTQANRPLVLDGQMTIDRSDFGMTAYRFIVGRKVTIDIHATMVPGTAEDQGG